MTSANFTVSDILLNFLTTVCYASILRRICNMKSKLFSVLSIMVVFSMFLGASAAPGRAPTGETGAAAAPASDQATAAPAAEGQTEVIWYVRSNDDEQKWEEQVIKDFEAANPNIKINLVVTPWADFDTKMQTMIAAGTPPDIWSHWGPSGFADYVERGLVADLTPYIEKDSFDLSDFEEAVLDIYKVDGKIMGMPILTTGSFVSTIRTGLMPPASSTRRPTGMTPPGLMTPLSKSARP